MMFYLLIKASRKSHVAAAGFKSPEMTWGATALRDELPKFTQYCDLTFNAPFSKKSAK